MNAHFIGHLSGSKAYYKGMYWRNGEFQHMGLYDEVSPFHEPSYKYNFTHFGIEEVIRVDPADPTDPDGQDTDPAGPDGDGGDDDQEGGDDGEADDHPDGLYEWCP